MASSESSFSSANVLLTVTWSRGSFLVDAIRSSTFSVISSGIDGYRKEYTELEGLWGSDRHDRGRKPSQRTRRGAEEKCRPESGFEDGRNYIPELLRDQGKSSSLAQRMLISGKANTLSGQLL